MPIGRGQAAGRVVDISVLGDRALERQLEALTRRLQRKLTRQALKPAMRIVERRSKQLVPVKTGLLKKNIKVRPMKRSRSRMGYLVTSGGMTRKGKMTDFTGAAYYGGFVEFGTVKMKGRSFLKRAAEQEEANVYRRFERKLKVLLSEV